MRTLSIIVILLFLANTGGVYAAEIALACKYEHSYTKDRSSNSGTWNYKGRTSGELSIKIHKIINQGRHNVIVWTSRYGPMLGTMNNSEVIAVETIEYYDGSLIPSRTYEIDRTTGEFRIALYAGKDSGMMHVGKCSVTKKLF